VKALKVEGEQKNATTDRVGDLWVMLALEDITSKYQYIQFPIFVGKKWSHRYQMTISGVPYWVDSQTEVTGVEEVTTPAGTFRAFKIERTARGAKGVIDQRRVYFYSPQTGSLVKYHMESGLGAVSDIELIKFGPTR
jgi:hypothetical protein